jgi:hypothetical protein
MEHAVVELAPPERSTPAARAVPAVRGVPAVRAAQPDLSGERRRSRRPWPLESAWRPVRQREHGARLRADMREFESALARWAR